LQARLSARFCAALARGNTNVVMAIPRPTWTRTRSARHDWRARDTRSAEAVTGRATNPERRAVREKARTMAGPCASAHRRGTVAVAAAEPLRRGQRHQNATRVV